MVNVSIAPLVGKSGERIGRLLLFDDITQRVRMEEQMLQTEKLTSLGLLAAGVAHEVNTPLAVISNYIQMLAKQMPEGDPRQAIIEKIVKQTFRASEIVNNLLNFSRTGAAEFRGVNLNPVVEETLSLVAHPLSTAQVQVVRNLQTGLPAVLGSDNKLQQVFLNLFMNARDAMPSGGMLEVRTAAHNGIGGNRSDRHGRRNSARTICTAFSIRSSPPKPRAAAPAWAFRELRHHQGTCGQN